MLYEHVNARGDVDERVRPVEGSPNAAQLAVKANDPNSGWRAVVTESTPAAAPAKGKADTTPKGVLS